MTTPDPLTLVRDPVSRDPLRDIALGPAWMRLVAERGEGATLRLYRPRPTVAFSARDCLTPGIGEAVRTVRAAGFAAVRRGPGGRATAYHPGCLGLDHVSAAPRGAIDIRARFADFGELLAGALRQLGVPAGVGEVPGEYCPGEFSVHDGGGRKLVGTAQRLVPGGWLFSSMIVVTDAAAVRDVLEPAYRHLGLSWRPETVGAVEDTVSGTPVEAVADAVVAAYGARYDLVAGTVPAAVPLAAEAAVDRHRTPEPG
ncbi:lipoate--protein ligase family protein [Nakamurella deserti]|uniref:lipoate--protein ligase family protein n=1 Tax=Nakamurella deserti TaxID=2164074 RepID=UPI00130047D6|nr:lipoate--protein ligase family protein [Nakamurella deserti]